MGCRASSRVRIPPFPPTPKKPDLNRRAFFIPLVFSKPTKLLVRPSFRVLLLLALGDTVFRRGFGVHRQPINIIELIALKALN